VVLGVRFAQTTVRERRSATSPAAVLVVFSGLRKASDERGCG
jgi:hypothetical protein